MRNSFKHSVKSQLAPQSSVVPQALTPWPWVHTRRFEGERFARPRPHAHTHTHATHNKLTPGFSVSSSIRQSRRGLCTPRISLVRSHYSTVYPFFRREVEKVAAVDFVFSLQSLKKKLCKKKKKPNKLCCTFGHPRLEDMIQIVQILPTLNSKS